VVNHHVAGEPCFRRVISGWLVGEEQRERCAYHRTHEEDRGEDRDLAEPSAPFGRGFLLGAFVGGVLQLSPSPTMRVPRSRGCRRHQALGSGGPFGRHG
jgi:hypothetical protein